MDALASSPSQSHAQHVPEEMNTQDGSPGNTQNAPPDLTMPETARIPMEIEPCSNTKHPVPSVIAIQQESIPLRPTKQAETNATEQGKEGEEESDVDSDEKSSASSSSSSSSSSSLSDEDDEDDEDEEVGGSKMEQEKVLEKMISQAAEVGLDDKFGPRTQNEVVRTEAELSPLPGEVGDDERITVAGEVMSVQRPLNSLVMKAVADSDSGVLRTLDHDSLICTESKGLVGRIEEVFGPVVSPFYVVRLMGQLSIQKDTAQTDLGDVVAEAKLPMAGDKLYVVDKFKKVVDPAQLSTVGSDASNLYNEEPGPEEVEYSDDEEEARARQEKRAQRNALRSGPQEATKRAFKNSRARNSADRSRHTGQRPIQPVNWSTSPPPPLPPVPQHIQMSQPYAAPQAQQYPHGFTPAMTPSVQPFPPPYHAQPFPNQSGVYFNQHAPVAFPPQPRPPLYAGHASYQEAAAQTRDSNSVARPVPPQQGPTEGSTKDINGLRPPGLD